MVARAGKILMDVAAERGIFEQGIFSVIGHPVVICNGPDATCPMLGDDGYCELVDQAGGVFFQLDLDRAEHRQLLEKYKRVLPPGVPIRVLLASGQAEMYADLLAGVELWDHEPTIDELVEFSASVDAYDRGISGDYVTRGG